MAEDTSEHVEKKSLPGWLKGCLIGCVVLVVLSLIVVGGIFWATKKFVFTPENINLLKNAQEVSKKVNPKDMDSLSSFFTKVSNGEIKLTEEQQTQMDGLLTEIENGNIDDTTPDKILLFLQSVDKDTFSDSEKWKETIKTVMPVIKTVAEKASQVNK